ncbi:hypothetical protein L6278_02430 [Candidatus Parcubacteria bacterium]|nr:hypothetical protein [Patescibacteria group bacterium]MBU4482260.1 hypothetical protein [Patescibacteria group bacterium]MCG2686971.1 hypothetical protein [Candidatus Parcubacteria bacterium]
MKPVDNNYQENDNIYSNNKKSSISPKLVFGVLIFLGMGTLAFGFINLTRNIYDNKFKGNENETADTQQKDLVTDLLELQAMDTDKDGLSDYDEIYIYKTSPYLADTDSDGYLDKEEIDTGHDPLCPVGQDCRGTELPDDSAVDPNSILPYDESLLGQDGSIQEQGANEEIPADLMNELINLTPDQVRELLRTSGQMTEEQLAEIDDETLMQIYREVLGN